MKKVGIFTFHASHNNGSMLQAVALQNILREKYNMDAELINFSNKAQQNMYAPFSKVTNYKKFIKNMIYATNYKQILRQYKSYNAFMKKYFKLSGDIISNEKEFETIKNNYDAFITGSDQVWNIKAQDADDIYYLNFETDKLKFAYAVSFGANNPFESEKKDYYTKCLRDFDLISVRENNAKKWINQSTQINPEICLDPTMLLSKEEWENNIDLGVPIIKGKYIFYYCFSINSTIEKFLKKVSIKYNMPVYFMDVKEWTLKTCWKNKIKLIKEYGPDVYINVVKNAEMFITTSFHGTAFATIFKKNFWYINTGGDITKDDRAVSFLTQLGLMDRYKTIDELSSLDLNVKPNYDIPYQKLNSLKEKSYGYIEKMIGMINDDK